MSQPPSSQSSSPDDQNPAPRRLISPRERFADPPSEPEIAAVEPEIEPENPFDAQISARRRDEMERRHLPPRERARRERARLKRERMARRPAPLPASDPATASNPATREQRARAERDFARSAREVPPTAPPKTPRPRRPTPRWFKQLLGLVALIFVGELGFAAFTAPQFNVESVEIRGIGATPPVPLRRLAHGLIGQNWLRLNSNLTRRDVELLPTVADAKVVRLLHWPPKVALQIREREAVLKVGAGGDWWVVDRGGVPFRRPNANDGALYSVVAPQFSPVVRRPLQVKLWNRALALATALEADNRLADREENHGSAAKIEAKSRFWQLRRVYFDRDGLASLRLSSEPHREMLVRLGDDAWPEKLARARQSLGYFERTGRRAAELDLVSLERPVWKQKVPRLAVRNGERTAENAGERRTSRSG